MFPLFMTSIMVGLATCCNNIGFWQTRFCLSHSTLFVLAIKISCGLFQGSHHFNKATFCSKLQLGDQVIWSKLSSDKHMKCAPFAEDILLVLILCFVFYLILFLLHYLVYQCELSHWLETRIQRAMARTMVYIVVVVSGTTCPA